MENKFPHPLDTDVVESVPVKRIVVDSFDEKTGQASVSIKTVMEKRTVRYMEVPKVKHRCKNGEHVFRVFNKSKYIFACIECQFSRKVYPSSYIFDQSTGKLISRTTGQSV